MNDPYPDFVANAEYEQMYDPVCTVKEIVRAGCGFLRASKRINAGEEVLVSYGRRHLVHAGARHRSSAS